MEGKVKKAKREEKRRRHRGRMNGKGYAGPMFGDITKPHTRKMMNVKKIADEPPLNKEGFWKPHGGWASGVQLKKEGHQK